MGYPRVCMSCRARRGDGDDTCLVCSDTLLDLARADDREIARLAIEGPSLAVGLTFGGFFLAVCVVAFSDLVRSVASFLALLPVVGMIVATVAVRRVRLRRWGISAHDLRGPEERAQRRESSLELVTAVPLWSAIACVGVAIARAISPQLDAWTDAWGLRFGDARSGAIGPSIVLYALLHSDLGHLVANTVGLLFFGLPVEKRVGRLGALALLVAGVVAGGIAEPLFSGGPGSARLVGISAGVYAWIAAHAILDPSARTVLVMQFVRLPMPMWLRTMLLLTIFSGASALVQERIAHFAHLGGAIAGLVVAIPLRWVKPRASYLRWRNDSAARADAA